MAKNDNAVSNTTLWDEAALKNSQNLSDEIDFIARGKDYDHAIKALDFLRTAKSKRYKKNVRFSFMKYMKTFYSLHVFEDGYENNSYDFQRDMQEGKQAVEKAADTSFWDWDNGPFLISGGGNQK